MTCFWKGLLDCLRINIAPKLFVQHLKQKNKICKNVKWQNESLSNQFLKESFEAVKCFNEKSIHNGYLCSTCDPFLILVCELYKTDIVHNYCGNIITYKYKDSNKEIRVISDRGHFKKW